MIMCYAKYIVCTLIGLILITCVNGISELKPFQIISYQKLSDRRDSRYIFSKDNAFFHYIPGHPSSNEIYLGARNRLFSVPVPDVSNAREVLKWEPDIQCKEPYFKCESGRPSKVFSCGNHIRSVLSYSSGEKRGSQMLAVCGSYGGNPKCRLYRRNDLSNGTIKKPMWIPNKSDMVGQGTVSGSVCPEEKNPFYFNKNTMKLFVSTHAEGVPSFVRFNVSDRIAADKYVRDKPFLYGKSDLVTFHTIFSYKGKIYILFNEEAYESDYNSVSIMPRERKKEFKQRKKRFARVARVCEDDHGSKGYLATKELHKFSTFYKARLLCRSPEGFRFDYLVAVNELDDSEKDPIIRGVFASDDGLTNAHGICAFRTSEIERGITEGEFVAFKITDKGSFLQRKPFPLKREKFNSCLKGAKASIAVASIARKHPLRTDPVMNDDKFPWSAFTANKYNITAIAIDKSTNYEVVILGTDTGLLLKLAALPKTERKPNSRDYLHVVESVQVFLEGTRINTLLLRKGYIIAISNHEVRSINIQRCKLRKNCRDCVALGDPHCSWDVLTQTCSTSGMNQEFTYSVSLYRNVMAGMKYCDNTETN